MKVLDLQCGRQHTFEGWFGSEEDFQSQLARSLVECPVCGDTGILKRLSAPRLNLGATQAPDKPAGESRSVAAVPAPNAAQQAAFLQAVRHVLANTEDVGAQFAEEARKIHYGEADERNIRGQATAEETAELLEEGIAVMPLPIPKALKGPLQ
ncbi:hypothetical protein RD110_17225 [Rhodoferax koreense]|uniref:Uncharacterized protein n=1 Tax=Rhodoferax koreensis TaxID=1842727 RepID=A0A1P8JYB5_9BURK|nr:DUF1178 family protein [Rhodoferax koreense]APW38728.1 hypothetical protein RD110_17225 [Rhodoferax koreense]